MERLTKRANNGLPYLAKVKDNEQDIYSDYRNTLQCVQEAFKKLAEYEEAEEQGLLFDIKKQHDLKGTKRIIHALIEQYIGVPVPIELIDTAVDNLIM